MSIKTLDLWAFGGQCFLFRINKMKKSNAPSTGDEDVHQRSLANVQIDTITNTSIKAVLKS